MRARKNETDHAQTTQTQTSEKSPAKVPIIRDFAVVVCGFRLHFVACVGLAYLTMANDDMGQEPRSGQH